MSQLRAQLQYFKQLAGTHVEGNLIPAAQPAAVTHERPHGTTMGRKLAAHCLENKQVLRLPDDISREIQVIDVLTSGAGEFRQLLEAQGGSALELVLGSLGHRWRDSPGSLEEALGLHRDYTRKYDFSFIQPPAIRSQTPSPLLLTPEQIQA